MAHFPRARLRSRLGRTPVLVLAAATLVMSASSVALAQDTTPPVGTQPPTAAPVPADTASAPDVGTAVAVAAAYGHPVEVTSEDTASSTSFANPDGTATDDLSSTPVRVRQSSGGWLPVDLTLQSNSSGTITPTVSPVSVTLGAGGSSTIGTLKAGTGSVTYSWASALPTPTLAGPVATYPNVLPGVDIEAAVSTSGLEVSLVVKTPAAAAEGPMTLEVTASGLTASKDESGVVTYADQSGDIVARTPAPQAWDSELGGDLTGPGAGPIDDAQSAITTAAGAALAPKAGPGTVASATGVMTDQLQVPPALIEDPSVAYPILLDPGVGIDQGYQGYVENDGYNEMDTGFDSGYVHVGTYDGGTTVTRGMYSFAEGATAGATVTGATLKLTNVYSWSCTGEPVVAYHANPFDDSATWSSAGVGSVDDVSGSFAYGYSSSCPYSADNVSIDVTNIAQASGGESAYYIQLRANESNDSYWKKFSPTATLDVTYHTIPTVPTNLAATPCYAYCTPSQTYTSSSNPYLSAVSTTADHENLQYQYMITTIGVQPSTMPPTGTDAPSTSYTYNTPSSYHWGGAPVYSGAHQFQVRACDAGTSVCSDWATGYALYFDTTHPATPGYNASGTTFDLTNGPTAVGTEGLPGNIELTDTSTDVYEYAYSMQPGTIVNPPLCNPSVGIAVAGDVTAICGTSKIDGSGNATISITPGQLSNTLTVAAVDRAGNTTGAAWTFSVNASVSSTPAHAWMDTDNQDMDGYSSVADWSGAGTEALPATFSGSASVGWAGTGNGPNQDALSFTGAFAGSTAGAATAAATSSGAAPLTIDGADSFTVAAWVDPTTASLTDGNYHTAVAMERPGGGAQFWLQMQATTTGGVWRFCLPFATGSNNCATSTVAAVAGTFTLLVGEWDASTQQMTIYVGDKDHSTTAAHTNEPASSTGAIVIGRGPSSTTMNANAWNLWDGQIADPIVYNYLLPTSQINLLAAGTVTALPTSNIP